MPYWVQAELKPDPAGTGAMDLDLDLVFKTHIIREGGRKMTRFILHYSTPDGPQPMGFEGEQAESAYQAWRDYLKKSHGGVRYISPQAKALAPVAV